MQRERVPSLTRALIERAFPQPVPDDQTAMRLLDENVIAAWLDRTLAARGAAEEQLWLFAYSSLMWRPELDFHASRQISPPDHQRF